MDCLYQTTTTYSYEEIKRFNWSVLLSRKKIIILALLELLILLCGFIFRDSFYIALAIICPILFVIFLNRDIKKTYNSNKSSQNLCVKFEFYDTYFTETNENGEARLEYAKLYKIIETKTNFYLMIAKNQGFILNKANMPEGLAEFLRDIKL